MKPFLKAKIGGHVWNYFLVSRFKEKDTLAKCYFSKNRISIKKGMVESAQKESAFHETVHAVDPDMGEARVQAFSQQLYQTLKDNPQLLNFIFPR